MNQLMTSSAPPRGAMPPISSSPGGADPLFNQLLGGPAAQPAPRPSAPLPQQASPQAELERLAKLRNVFGDLLQKPKVSFRDAVDAILNALEDRVLSPREASLELASFSRKDTEKNANRIADCYVAVSHAHAAMHHAVYGDREANHG